MAGIVHSKLFPHIAVVRFVSPLGSNLFMLISVEVTLRYFFAGISVEDGEIAQHLPERVKRQGATVYIIEHGA